MKKAFLTPSNNNVRLLIEVNEHGLVIAINNWFSQYEIVVTPEQCIEIAQKLKDFVSDELQAS